MGGFDVRCVLLAALFAIGASSNAAAATRYVSAATGANSGDCSDAANPCRTITYAMGQAAAGDPGDLISVAPGTYNLSLGEVFPILFKPGVQLVSIGTPFNTIVDATGDTANGGIVRSTGNNSPAAKIDGFTFTNGLVTDVASCSTPMGGALFISGSNALFTVSRNIFSANEARGYSSNGSGGFFGCTGFGGALAVVSSTVNVVNNMFTRNSARGGNGFSHTSSVLTGDEHGGLGEGGAIYFLGSGTVMHNTFHNNAVQGGNGGLASNGPGNGGPAIGGGISTGNAGTPAVQNNIFTFNFATSGSGGTPDTATAAALIAANSTTIRNNLFYSNIVNGSASFGDTLGSASIQADPLYHSSTSLRIRPSSPANGAGSTVDTATLPILPAVDLDGTVRPSPPAIGAFEASGAEPSISVTSSPNPSNQGEGVVFTAILSTPNGDTLTGTATFNADATILCDSVTLVSNQAQCATSALLGGTHSITVDYSGDASFLPTTSDPLTQEVNQPPPPPPARLFGISTRVNVLTLDDVMIGGFIIDGTSPKQVVVRARGPSLGVSGALTNPTLTVVPTAGGPNLVNDDWQTAPNAAALSASGFAPGHPNESAILAALNPGAYTAIVSGVGNTTGVALVEVYEMDHPDVPLIGISTRGRVQTGDNVMIGGFVITGSAPLTVVVRARGPSLGVAGALADPTMTIVPAAGGSNYVNDDWQQDANAAALQASGFAPGDPRESAIMRTLNPGAYTAIVSGRGGTTGVAIVEVYVVD